MELYSSLQTTYRYTRSIQSYSHVCAEKKKFNGVKCSFQFSTYDYSTACIQANNS